MSATMTDARPMTTVRDDDAPARPSQLRVTRHGYDPEDVHSLLASARARLVSLADRIRKAEAANVALVAEVHRWKERARTAEAERRRLEDALAAAEATVATDVAEIQVRADHLIERARCEADHLTLRAHEEARRVREELEQERQAVARDPWMGEDGLRLDADPDQDRIFSRFMSEEIEDEPSREWVIGAT